LRGTCGIAKRLLPNGKLDICGKPSVYTEPCNCDRCEADPGYHIGIDYCAEHFDELEEQQQKVWARR